MMWFCGKTDIGKVRQLNEDFYLCDAPHLAIVADGMGGHAAGEIASKMATRSVTDFLDKQDMIDEDVLRLAIVKANEIVYHASESNRDYSGMGTTMIICYEKDGVIYWAHVGDSRFYLYRDGKLHQITQDHSFVGELERSGQITKEEAETHPKRNLLMRAIGADSEIEVDTGSLPVLSDDIILLCTDGLTNMVSEFEIGTALEMHREELGSLPAQLIDHANENGGNDNITVLLGKKENGIKQDT